MSLHHPPNHRPDRGIGMNRPQKLDVGEQIVQLLDRLADLLDRLSKAVASVGRDQNQALSWIEIDANC